MTSSHRTILKSKFLSPSHYVNFLKPPHEIHSSVKMKFRLNLILILFVWVMTPSAWAGTLSIDAGPDWIKGKADEVSIGQVLAQVAEKTGYAVYLDEDLVDLPISFDIQDQMASEAAIRRIIQPHSYAMVYSKRADGNGFDILEVRVYTKGRQSSARYKPLNPGSTRSAGINGTSGIYNPSASANGPGAGIGGDSSQASNPGSSIDPRSLISLPYEAKEGAFGQGVAGTGNPEKGPDYRLSPSQMQEAYAQFQEDKKAYQRRVSNAQNTKSRAGLAQRKEDYKDQRNRALKKYLEQNN